MPERVRLTTPFGTSYVLTVDPSKLDVSSLTQQDIDRLTDDLIRRGVIAISPDIAKSALLQGLAGLKPEDRAAWLNALRTRPSETGRIPVTLSGDELLALYEAGSPLSRFAVPDEITLNISPSDMRAFQKFSHLQRVRYITEELEPQLQRLSPEVMPRRYAKPAPDDKVMPIYSPHLDEATAAARKYGIPEDLFLALITQESRWKPNARSPKGALGLGQLMPGTAKALGVDPLVPEENLDGAARYLKQQFDRFGTWELALAAYNAGPNAVAKTLRDGKYSIPPFAETRKYVQAVTSLASRMPVTSIRGAARAVARQMAEQQLRINPGHTPREAAAIVAARLVKENLMLPPKPDPRTQDYWNFIFGMFSGKADFGSLDTLTHSVLSTIPGDSPAIRAMARNGFDFDFGRDRFLANPSIETPLGSVPAVSPEFVNALFSPTENTAVNVATLGVMALRLGVPLRGFAAGARAASAAGRSTISAIGAGLAGAFRREVQVLGAFDFTYAAAQLAPSIVLNSTVTADDLKAAVMNVLPFVNILAPGVGDAFARNGVDGQIDWENASLPAWFSGALKHIVPEFRSVDTAITLPALGLAAVFGRRGLSRQVDALRQEETVPVPEAQDTLVRLTEEEPTAIAGEQPVRLPEEEPVIEPGAEDLQPRVEDSQPRVEDAQPRTEDSQPRVRDGEDALRRIEEPPAEPGGEQPGEIVAAGVDSGDLAIVSSTKGRVVVKSLPQGYDVIKDTPREMLPEGVKPGELRTVDTPDGKRKVAVAVSRKTSTGIPFGYLHLGEDAPRSAFEIAHEGIVRDGEGAIYSADNSLGKLELADERFLATAEARQAADGSVVTLPIVYKVGDVYRLSDVLRSAELTRRAARAFGFGDDVDAFRRAVASEPPEVHIAEPAEGQASVVGGRRRSAVDENGYIAFVTDATYRGHLPHVENQFIGDVMRVVEYARSRKQKVNDRRFLRRAARALGVSDEVIAYLESADAIAVTPDGVAVIRHTPRPEIIDPDITDAVRAGVPIDAGTATLLGRHGAVDGDTPRLTIQEADGLMSELMRRRADGEDCP